ncbi:MAG: response regulator [Candidatus Roizmanbacteria bacterium]
MNTIQQYILVAEDDIFLASAYRIKLTKVGYEVQIARDGAEVFTYLENKIPDLILLDLIMPLKNGFDVLTELKKNIKWSNVPIIIASNLGQKDDIDKGMSLGATDYVVKSDISLEQLVEKIQTILKN